MEQSGIFQEGNATNFHLHPQLAKDGIDLGKFQLCRLLLMNDSQFPWCVLVPQVAEVTEIYQLDVEMRKQLMDESCLLAQTLVGLYRPDKINIAAIGNLVPQLHLHHVARFRTDKLWPSPIWGKLPAIPYDDAKLAETVGRLREACRGIGLT